MINIYMKMEHISLFSRLQFIGGCVAGKKKACEYSPAIILPIKLHSQKWTNQKIYN